jgi:hypothetical protein
VSTALERILESRRATDQRLRSERTKASRQHTTVTTASAGFEAEIAKPAEQAAVAANGAHQQSGRKPWRGGNIKGNRSANYVPKPPDCALCDGDHNSDECTKFIRIDER